MNESRRQTRFCPQCRHWCAPQEILIVARKIGEGGPLLQSCPSIGVQCKACAATEVLLDSIPNRKFKYGRIKFEAAIQATVTFMNVEFFDKLAKGEIP